MKNSIKKQNIKIWLILIALMTLPVTIQSQFLVESDGTYVITSKTHELDYKPIVASPEWFKGFFRTLALFVTNDKTECELDSAILGQKIKLHIYYPTPDNAHNQDNYDLPVIVFGYGGGFLNKWAAPQGIPPGNDYKVPEYFAKRGYIVIAPEYRIGIDLHNAQLAERAIWRAVQDLRVTIRYARAYVSDNLVKADTNAPLTYLGWSSGGFMGLHNLYLRDTGTNRPISTTDSLEVDYDVSNWFLSTVPIEGSTYDLGTLDAPRHGKGDDDFTNYYPELQGDPVQDISVIVSGALGKLNWIGTIPDSTTTGRPKALMMMQHRQDGVVPSGKGKAYQGFSFFQNDSFQYPEVNGTFAIDEYFTNNPDYRPQIYEFLEVTQGCANANCVEGNAGGDTGPLGKQTWYHDPMEYASNLAVMGKIESFIEASIDSLSSGSKLAKTPLLDKGQSDLYPNPTLDYVNIKMTDKKVSEFRIYDISGNLLLSQEISNTNDETLQIDVSNFSEGIYMLHLFTDTEIEFYKIAKQ
ncbi:T9SS type A sorting domain-containing protein [Aquimarina pacifica]|uniref:T9SS type A sorting domain-containing protein n=1 Tax=Aquimarina pacifica TaxID=1296415 RepID=UPI0004716504|nr:T9SS type A sorting domain-containing protein [Aquimarina pacifica]